MKIKVIRHGIVHCHAGCDSCDFSASIQTEQAKIPNDVRRLVRAHVRQTGHEVWMESGTHTRYRSDVIVRPTRRAPLRQAQDGYGATGEGWC